LPNHILLPLTFTKAWRHLKKRLQTNLLIGGSIYTINHFLNKIENIFRACKNIIINEFGIHFILMSDLKLAKRLSFLGKRIKLVNQGR
jgi:hypothetical protein